MAYLINGGLNLTRTETEYLTEMLQDCWHYQESGTSFRDLASVLDVLVSTAESEGEEDDI